MSDNVKTLPTLSVFAPHPFDIIPLRDKDAERKDKGKVIRMTDKGKEKSLPPLRKATLAEETRQLVSLSRALGQKLYYEYLMLVTHSGVPINKTKFDRWFVRLRDKHKTAIEDYQNFLLETNPNYRRYVIQGLGFVRRYT